jgi:hypothetical protein
MNKVSSNKVEKKVVDLVKILLEDRHGVEISESYQELKGKVLVMKKIPRPWLGELNHVNCKALRVNHGLFTQCEMIPEEGGKYCGTCVKNLREGEPQYGSVYDRLTCTGKYKKEVKGKVREEESYEGVIKKLNLDEEIVRAQAKLEGWIGVLEKECSKIDRMDIPKSIAVVESDEEIPSPEEDSKKIPSTDIPSTDIPSTDIPSTDNSASASEEDSKKVPSTDIPSTDNSASASEEDSKKVQSTDIPSSASEEDSKKIPSTDISSTDISSTDNSASASASEGSPCLAEEMDIQPKNLSNEFEREAVVVEEDVIGKLVQSADTKVPTKSDLNKASIGQLRIWWIAHCGGANSNEDAINGKSKSELTSDIRTKFGYVKLSKEEKEAKKAREKEEKEKEKALKKEAKERKKLEKMEKDREAKKERKEQKKKKKEEKKSLPTNFTEIPVAVEPSESELAELHKMTLKDVKQESNKYETSETEEKAAMNAEDVNVKETNEEYVSNLSKEECEEAIEHFNLSPTGEDESAKRACVLKAMDEFEAQETSGKLPRNDDDTEETSGKLPRDDDAAETISNESIPGGSPVAPSSHDNPCLQDIASQLELEPVDEESDEEDEEEEVEVEEEKEDEEEEEDEDEVTASPWTDPNSGKEYLKDDEGNLYDMNTQEECGMYYNGRIYTMEELESMEQECS